MPMTDQERAALELTAELYKALLALPVDHPSDMAENVRNLHDIQNRLMARATYRAECNAWKA